MRGRLPLILSCRIMLHQSHMPSTPSLAMYRGLEYVHEIVWGSGGTAAWHCRIADHRLGIPPRGWLIGWTLFVYTAGLAFCCPGGTLLRCSYLYIAAKERRGKNRTEQHARARQREPAETIQVLRRLLAFSFPYFSFAIFMDGGRPFLSLLCFLQQILSFLFSLASLLHILVYMMVVDLNTTTAEGISAQPWLCVVCIGPVFYAWTCNYQTQQVYTDTLDLVARFMLGLDIYALS